VLNFGISASSTRAGIFREKVEERGSVFIFSESSTLLSSMWRCSSERKWSLLAAFATLFSVVSSEYSTSWMTTSMCETKLESSQVKLLRIHHLQDVRVCYPYINLYHLCGGSVQMADHFKRLITF
jgi:hypothetical protein